MGKIPVQQLAKMMGISEQDLVFKLKSIGVRVDDKEPHIDTEVMQALIQGKRLTQPREVILRDKEDKSAPPPPRRPPARRPTGSLRPPRRRTMIQKVEPRIRTIPVSERPKPAPAPAAAAPPATGTPDAPPVETPPPGTAPTDPIVTPDAAPEGTAAPPTPAVSGRRQRRAERKQATSEATDLPFAYTPPEEPVTLSEGMTVRQFADKLDIKTKDLLQLLFDRGVMATINHVLEPELAEKLASSLGAETMQVTFEEEVQLQQDSEGEESSEGTDGRAPVVTIMGHVDHGKTTLLDSIRSSKITAGEAGGITQHIGAYHVDVDSRQIVFLDTPGHEAFTLMRARGARVTDIVILVVAADDSVMPQTIEAIDHARAAEVPIIVAINKIDKAGANADRVKADLANHDINVEDWGGDIVSVPISALNGDGIDSLLEMILITADLLELKASPAKPAQGVVLEARKEAGKGNVATVLVQDGTLHTSDVFVSGAVWGRVRVMSDDRGERIKEAPPATPVEVAGFNGLPEAGDTFQVVEEESLARGIVEFRQAELRKRELSQKGSPTSLEQLFARIQSGDVKELSIVLKADVQGSVEVLTDTLEKLSTDQVKVNVIRAGVGAVTTHDVLLASASEAIIIGFNVRPERKAAELADKEEVEIRLHTVIYELSDELRKAMVGLLEPTYKEVNQGQAEVREIFKVPKIGMVAGCHVVEGLVSRSAMARLVRDNRVVYEGRIGTLRRFKDDVAEVRTGFDCGIRLENFQDLKPGDYIQTYVEQEVAPTL